MHRLVSLVVVSFACVSLGTMTAQSAEPRSLLKTIAEWQYPGSVLADTQSTDGETIDAKGKRTLPSVVHKTVMTTEAPVEKVLEYYKTRLSLAERSHGGGPESLDGGRSVFFSDDSIGRPFALHTAIINTSDTSTTLVISRGKDEANTHISWTQYRRYSR